MGSKVSDETLERARQAAAEERQRLAGMWEQYKADSPFWAGGRWDSEAIHEYLSAIAAHYREQVAATGKTLDRPPYHYQELGTPSGLFAVDAATGDFAHKRDVLAASPQMVGVDPRLPDFVGHLLETETECVSRMLVELTNRSEGETE